MTESSSDQIKHYAFLVTQSTNVDTDSLNHCLDDILNVLVDYLKIIEKVSFLLFCFGVFFILFLLITGIELCELQK